MRPWGDRLRLASDHSVVPNANNRAYHIAARRERNRRAIWYCTQTVNAPIVLAHHSSASGRPPNRSPAKKAATSRRAKKPAVRHQRSRQRKPAFHQSQQRQHQHRRSQRKIAVPVSFGAAFRPGPCDGRPLGRNTLQTVIGHARRVRHKPIDTRTAMLHQAHGSRHTPVGIVREKRRTDAVHQPHGGEQT